uniref:Uncharacterized protein n=1 Tax=Anopheles farauti TaxID=69004 RepID=A0A182QLU0_9DIPT
MAEQFDELTGVLLRASGFRRVQHGRFNPSGQGASEQFRLRTKLEHLQWSVRALFASEASLVLLNDRLTSSRLRRFASHRLRQPISVDIYHPLKAVAVNWMPPQSNNIDDTIGTAYHRRFSSANHLNCGWLSGTSRISSGG